MEAAHIETIDQGIGNSMLKAGIGKLYHRRTLDSLETGGEWMKKWVEGNLAEVAQGKGLVLHTPGVAGQEAFVLLARAMLLSRLSVRIVPVITLARQLEWDEKMMAYDHSQCLFLSKFVQEGDNPLPRYDQITIEAFLDKRWDAGKANFFWVPGKLDMRKWWSLETVQRVSQLCSTTEVPK